MKIHFTKMHGCGNDYVYINGFEYNIENPSELAVKLSDRHFGIGGDGIILVNPSDKADAQMRIFNADGSEGKMCGNGIRCVAKFLYDNKITKGRSVKIDTLSGIKDIDLFFSGPNVIGAKVNMGMPIFNGREIPTIFDDECVVDKAVEIDGTEYRITCVSMGNPHCVVISDTDPYDIDLEHIGPKFENSHYFPERVNTEFVKITGENEVKMRVWERGSAETWACGTGACATAVACILNGYFNKNENIRVNLRGGALDINYTDAGVLMFGEAVSVFEGDIEI